ncbi:hypothetical protein ACOMHN_028033 [Nucella lapillus]
MQLADRQDKENPTWCVIPSQSVQPPYTVTRRRVCDRSQHTHTARCKEGQHGNTCREVDESSRSHSRSVLCRCLPLLASVTRMGSTVHLDSASSPTVKDWQGPEQYEVSCPSNVHLEVLLASCAAPELREVSAQEGVLWRTASFLQC